MTPALSETGSLAACGDMAFETSIHDAAIHMNEQETLVIFRRWRDTGSIIALFPEIPTDINGWFCEAYEHVGQHGGADYQGVIAATKPVTLAEAADLAKELARVGYNLKSIRRASQQNHEARRAEARRARTAKV